MVRSNDVGAAAKTGFAKMSLVTSDERVRLSPPTGILVVNPITLTVSLYVSSAHDDFSNRTSEVAAASIFGCRELEDEFDLRVRGGIPADCFGDWWGRLHWFAHVP